MREIRRRTRVVGAFPDGHSALMLVAARLRHVAATKWGTKRYLQMDRLAEVVAITEKYSSDLSLRSSRQIASSRVALRLNP